MDRPARLAWPERADLVIRAENVTDTEVKTLLSNDPPKTHLEFYKLLVTVSQVARLGRERHGESVNGTWEPIWTISLGCLFAFCDPPPVQSREIDQTAALKDFANTEQTAVASPNHNVVKQVFDHALQQSSSHDTDALNVAIRVLHSSLGPTYLLEHGALYSCAFHGSSELLQEILKSLAGKYPRDQDFIDAICRDRSGNLAAQGTYTALAAAILKLQPECVEVFGYWLELKDSHRHLFDFVTACDGRTPILHFAIDKAQEYCTVQEREGHEFEIDVPNLASILNSIVLSCPETLLAFSDGTVLAKAENLDKYLEQRDLKLTFSNEKFAAMIKRLVFENFSSADDIDSVQQALYQGTEQSKELHLELSDFSYDQNNFERFLEELEDYTRQWDFESTLLYLVLPNLARINAMGIQTYSKAANQGTRRGMGPTGSPASRTLLRFFKWLRDVCKVDSIIELTIPDDYEWTLTEAFVNEQLLQKYHIRRLDWRKLDVDLRLLADAPSRDLDDGSFVDPDSSYHSDQGWPLTEAAPGLFLEELHLYSSGNWGTLYHWASPDGLLCLRNLLVVYVTVVEPLRRPESPHRRATTSYERKFRSLLESSARSLGVDVLFELRWQDTISWATFTAQVVSVAQKAPARAPIVDDLQDCSAFLDKVYQETANSSLLKSLNLNQFRPTRVAVIDIGTDRLRSTICSNIEEGISFTKTTAGGTKILPWYTAADAHGTQMAYLVASVDPHCKLFPARVGSTRDNIDPEFAFQAIDWAIKKKVDIISISWTMKVYSKKLEEAIRRATTHPTNNESKALIFCSTADEGAYMLDKIWPADCEEVIKVSASDTWGHMRPASQRAVDVMIEGDRLLAQGPKYMTDCAEASVSGSSVSTALAAGVASLCLSLARMVDPKKADSLKGKTRLLKFFEEQMCAKDEKLILPAKLLKADWDIDSNVQPRVLRKFEIES